MKLFQHFSHRSATVHGGPASVLGGLPLPSRMNDRLRRERAVSDRYGHSFSLLVFEAGDPSVDPLPATHLVAALRRRLRASDEVGWLDRERIAVLLPMTSCDGACALLKDLRRSLEAQAMVPHFQVHTYQGFQNPCV